ncbi:hypothetical protein GIY23_17980 [Allosaccharopolyspora coralli]|uniref:DUF3558 domain-containing protein n=1 Tax=Allosaccharopolyspora coralli TaxID=2665642 RepID=A0A5Q3QI14_9PSEU|nr:hypothetical protein [Allosaccharopolyspora coralli]QGK71155.1 hypothetical protein GIY23_17980 [Allosaccharopolyspora coralli]
MRRRVRDVLVVLGLAAVLAGCAASAPDRQGRAAPRETAATALGDLRTVDPCSLADAGAWNEFGRVERAATVSLDYCLLRITRDETVIGVSFGELARNVPTAGNPVRRHGGVRIVEETPLPGHCARHVVLADGTSVEVSADLRAGGSGAGLCGVADTGAQAIADSLSEHTVRHREFPSNSLALVDACDGIAPNVMQDIPGLETAQPRRSPSTHQCRWGQERSDATRVQILHTAGAPPAVLHSAAVEERIANRRTVLSVVGGDPSVPLCSAETAHVPFGPPENGETEVAMIVVAVPGETGSGACEYARGLAERVWPNLPPI